MPKQLRRCLPEMVRQRYHVPRSWLNPSGNLLVIFEEWGGDPNGISLVIRTIDSVCADIFELQPTLLSYQRQVSGTINQPLRPKAHLRCSSGQKISSIKFASFGTPQGVCGSFKEGSCHAHKSYDAFEKVKPLKHSSDLPPPGNKRSYLYLRYMTIFLRPTSGAEANSLIWKYGVMELLTVCLAYKNDIEGRSKHCDGTEKEMGYRVS
ncbi:hypothetical protein IFM89_002933 [Coptis chinensis]|uniref:SUEL-type lectin domain-containing protein n=1 Tax=Coptis chinensis TaxID=261450 RepID=A0A835M447_9MAGN|nr:hypothetical protein IFM89_002933 [Coptis chinensis]